MLDTRKAIGRRKLRFDSLDSMLCDAEQLVRLGTHQVGNWSLAQNLDHLAKTQIASIDGFPKLLPVFIRVPVSLLLKRWFLKHGVPPSGPKTSTFTPPDDLTAETALHNLRAATVRVTRETKRSPNPVFGRMTMEEWNLLYLRHAELHLSFCIPQTKADEQGDARKSPVGRKLQS